VLDHESGKVLREVQGSKGNYFAVELLSDQDLKDCPILFEIKIAGRGTIILDMFQRKQKLN